ncbi:Amt family ammonium transporter [Ereboglobus sp. PH5-10]|nr:ammonium transporter [Ereboglobus sp. PH5-10]MDF9826820.1 Amt family ammonium transporter [Ereboglobus sp. PH5-10]
MKANSFSTLFRAVTCGISILLMALAARAETPGTASVPLSTEARLGALEAYINNAPPPADAPLAGTPGPGHNGWMMTSTALVLFMTLPGLALFYGGLVRRKNVLSVLAQCLGIAGLSTVLWWAIGFSLSFAPGNSFIGGLDHVFFKGVTSATGTLPWVSQNVFAMFQLTFAIITPALIVGAIAERMKFTAIMAFITVWMFVVYYPLAHMVWGGGLMSGAAGAIKAVDFAGGTVVHMSSGWSALVLCVILGPRLGFGREKMAPHSMVLCMVGTAILWIGWYGFNAGSAGGADGIAANAFMTTTLCTGVGGFTWGVLEYVAKRKPSVLGFCSGIVAGLVVITPAAGFVNATGAVICGVFAGIVPYFAVVKLKAVFGYDDALDTFGVHAVGGTLGAILTGVLATTEVNPGIAGIMDGLLLAQLKAVGVTLAWSIIATVIIAYLVKAVIGLRPAPEAERQGLDISDHGEEGYINT